MTVNPSMLVSTPMAKPDYAFSCLFEQKHSSLAWTWHDRERIASSILTQLDEADWADHQRFTAKTSFMNALASCMFKL